MSFLLASVRKEECGLTKYRWRKCPESDSFFYYLPCSRSSPVPERSKPRSSRCCLTISNPLPPPPKAPAPKTTWKGHHKWSFLLVGLVETFLVENFSMDRKCPSLLCPGSTSTPAKGQRSSVHARVVCAAQCSPGITH